MGRSRLPPGSRVRSRPRLGAHAPRPSFAPRLVLPAKQPPTLRVTNTHPDFSPSISWSHQTQRFRGPRFNGCKARGAQGVAPSRGARVGFHGSHGGKQLREPDADGPWYVRTRGTKTYHPLVLPRRLFFFSFLVAPSRVPTRRPDPPHPGTHPQRPHTKLPEENYSPHRYSG